MKIKKYAKAIIGILRRREDGLRTTIHPRWDMELFSYLFSSEDEDEIDDEKSISGTQVLQYLNFMTRNFRFQCCQPYTGWQARAVFQ